MELLRSTSLGAILLCFGLILFYSAAVQSCNESVCGSIVSKCMLTSACKCELKNCSCCLECIKCLGKKYYADCCSCVELCPKSNDTARNTLSKKSNVEDFEGVPELFNVLVQEAPEYDWDTVTFQTDFDTLSRPKHNNIGNNDKDLDDGMKERDNMITVNCTVIYLDQCTSWNKCQQTCKSTGASSYRWFHDGCCECVGSTCINYGLKDSRCRNCPESKDEIDEGVEEEMYDFGDGVGPFDGVNNNF